MKLINLVLLILASFTVKLFAVPAAPFLITFAQPDGSTFQAHLKGDEYFNWIETDNKMIIVKSKNSGFFEFALIKRDEKNRLILFPSGVPVIKRGHSALRTYVMGERAFNEQAIVARDQCAQLRGTRPDPA